MEEKGKAESKWYYNPWVVILLLIFVLGPFGLPLVYRSPHFSRLWKIFWTLLMAVYTWYLIVATIEVFKYVQSVFSLLNPAAV